MLQLPYQNTILPIEGRDTSGKLFKPDKIILNPRSHDVQL